MPATMPLNPAPIHTTLIRRGSSIEKSGSASDGDSIEAPMGAENLGLGHACVQYYILSAKREHIEGRLRGKRIITRPGSTDY